MRVRGRNDHLMQRSIGSNCGVGYLMSRIGRMADRFARRLWWAHSATSSTSPRKKPSAYSGPPGLGDPQTIRMSIVADPPFTIVRHRGRPDALIGAYSAGRLPAAMPQSSGQSSEVCVGVRNRREAINHLWVGADSFSPPRRDCDRPIRRPGRSGRNCADIVSSTSVRREEGIDRSPVSIQDDPRRSAAR